MLPLWDDVTRRRTPVVTLLLITANLAVFAYQVKLALESGRALTAFTVEHALVPQRLFAGYADPDQWQTIFTSMFLHAGVAHVAGNCWFLWVFGKNVEDRLGPFLYLLFYLCSGMGAATLQLAVDPFSKLPMLGASGAISGVLGAYLVLFPTAWIYTLVPWIVPIVPLPAFLLLIAWFALQAMNGLGSLLRDEAATGGVAWWAHAGGFVAGAALAMRAKRLRRVRRR